MDGPSPDLRLTASRSLPRSALEWSFTHASGPGGQNVNKRLTAALLRVGAADLAAVLPEDAMERLRLLAGAAWVGEGADAAILLRADAARSQVDNRAACEERLLTLLKMALVVPKVRRKKKVSRGAKLRRLANKKHQSEKKNARRGE